MFIASVMSSNYPILWCPLFLLPSIFPSIRDFSNESALLIRWPKYWSFSFSISPSNEYSGLISFRIDGFDLLAVQGTLKSLPQYYHLKESFLQCSAFLRVQLSHSHVYDYWKNHSLTIQSGVGKVVSLLFNMLTRFAIAFCPRSKHLFFKPQNFIVFLANSQENETDVITDMVITTKMEIHIREHHDQHAEMSRGLPLRWKHRWLQSSGNFHCISTQISAFYWIFCIIRSFSITSVGNKGIILLENLEQTSEKAMAPHSSTLAWKIPWTEEPGMLQSMRSLRVRHNWATSLSLFTFMHCRRNGNPLQCSCLENPRDEGVWWAAVYGVAQSRTRLKRLSSSTYIA